MPWHPQRRHHRSSPVIRHANTAWSGSMHWPVTSNPRPSRPVNVVRSGRSKVVLGMSRSFRWTVSEPPSSEDLDPYPATTRPTPPTTPTPSNAKSPFTPGRHLQNARRRKPIHIRRMQTCNRTLLLSNRRSGKILKIQRQFRNIRFVRVRYKDRPTSHDEPLSRSTQYPNDQGKQKHSNSLKFSLPLTTNTFTLVQTVQSCAPVTNVCLTNKSLRSSVHPSRYQTLILFSRAFAIARRAESEVRAD